MKGAEIACWGRAKCQGQTDALPSVVVAATCHRPQLARRGANVPGHHLWVSLESPGCDHDCARPYRERLPGFIARRNSRVQPSICAASRERKCCGVKVQRKAML